MTDSQRVYPRQALVATRQEHYEEDGTIIRAQGWYVGRNMFVSDAEFAAHFMPADVLDRLLAAVGALVDHLPPGATNRNDLNLRAAWRAYRQQVDG